jgi:hypothetical protein
MITVDYFGRSGNNWFQYVYARLLSMERKHTLGTEPPKTFLKFSEYDQSQNTNGMDIHLHDYFQDAELYNNHRDSIKSMFILPTMVRNYDDVVVHLRLTDYWWHKNKWVISPLWYRGLIQREKYRFCYIVVEPHPTNEVYFKYLEGLKGLRYVTGGTAESDFNLIRSFDRIICSNSTYCWWAAFLSEASKIYTFKPWVKDKRVSLSNMAGATPVDGYFFRNKELENLDWKDYWLK